MKNKYKCPYCNSDTFETEQLFKEMKKSLTCGECYAQSPERETTEESYKEWCKPFVKVSILSKKIVSLAEIVVSNEFCDHVYETEEESQKRFYAEVKKTIEELLEQQS